MSESLAEAKNAGIGEGFKFKLAEVGRVHPASTYWAWAEGTEGVTVKRGVCVWSLCDLRLSLKAPSGEFRS